ncbi:MAE_28990/MAE_18760 family HEPN-like nuclease [Aeromonas media]|uniref:MAE_28990/MAE_18760 family HEPN-like nuclease n=1 Tax=Aeromonas media TaxID=651 RepID=UPI003D22EAB7
MPLSRVKRNKIHRFKPVSTNLFHISQGDVADDINKIQRGLYYVHLYSALEKTTNEIIERVLLIISGFKVKYEHYIAEFNTISLSAQMMSYKSATKDNAWLKSHDLFTTMCSLEEAKINESFFSASLQNIWFETVDNLLKCFGISTIEDVDGSLKIALNEVVDNRNAVAHGRISADIIGERHRSDVLRERTETVSNILDDLITKYEKYILDLEFIKPIYRSIYTGHLSKFTESVQ